MRFFLLIPILAATLQADAVTVVETSSSFGVTDLFYSYNVPTSPGAVTAFVRGDASCLNASACGSQPATAAIDLSMDLYTAGPARDGLALVQLTLTSGATGAGGTQISGNIGPFSLASCPKELTCTLSGYFPFELGVPFALDLSGLANGFPPLGGGQFFATASIQLFEAPPAGSAPANAPVQIYVVPEPGSAGLAFTGLSGLILFALRRRKASPSNAS